MPDILTNFTGQAYVARAVDYEVQMFGLISCCRYSIQKGLFLADRQVALWDRR